jgi:hypothetical protein
MLLFCCCAKSRQDEGSSILGIDSKDSNINRILLEFTTEEARIGLRNVPCLEMLEKLILVSTKEEIPKKEVVQIYKAMNTLNQDSIRLFLTQSFFFTDNTSLKYDFHKTILFNLLYTGGKETEKVNFLYGILETTSSSCIHNNSPKVILTLETLTQISCIVVGDVLNALGKFHGSKEDAEF